MGRSTLIKELNVAETELEELKSSNKELSILANRLIDMRAGNLPVQTEKSNILAHSNHDQKTVLALNSLEMCDAIAVSKIISRHSCVGSSNLNSLGSLGVVKKTQKRPRNTFFIAQWICG